MLPARYSIPSARSTSVASKGGFSMRCSASAMASRKRSRAEVVTGPHKGLERVLVGPYTSDMDTQGLDLQTIEEIRALKYRYLRAVDLKLWDELAGTLCV